MSQLKKIYINMKPVFASIEKEDTLYIVYNDLNGDYQIGEAKVTGFTNWTYTVGDRWEDWGEKPMTNINYEFAGIKFSRNLENSMDKTYFRDSPEYNEKYGHILGDKYVVTFTTQEEAKEFIVSTLESFIESDHKNIEKIENILNKHTKNLEKFINK